MHSAETPSHLGSDRLDADVECDKVFARYAIVAAIGAWSSVSRAH